VLWERRPRCDQSGGAGNASQAPLIPAYDTTGYNVQNFCTEDLDMTRVNVTELRQHLPGYLQQVRNGEEIEIAVHDKVIARLSPVGGSAKSRASAAGNPAGQRLYRG
jgi:antitoxin (DNA-binding transcriptional repressor) of toxin-antitoxin stability system